MKDGHVGLGGSAQSATYLSGVDGVCGGGYCQIDSNASQSVLDCVFDGCVASRGAAAFRGRLVRCHFVQRAQSLYEVAPYSFISFTALL